jgi:hypothetical protein
VLDGLFHVDNDDVYVDLPFLDDTGADSGSVFEENLDTIGVDEDYPFFGGILRIEAANVSIERNTIT